MHFSARSKLSILLSAVTVLTVVGTLLVAFVARGTPTRATNASPVTATYQGKSLTGSQIATSPGLPTKVVKSAHTGSAPLVPDSLNPYEGKGFGNTARRTVVSASSLPRVASLHTNAPAGTLLHNFNGISDTANDALNGFEVTPPDQGLCAGRDFTLPGDPSVVIEIVNDVVAEYTPSGHLLAAESIVILFQDPFATGDVRCFYDASNNAFYFTEIGFDPTGTHTVDDLAIFDHNGFAIYQFDSSMGGLCFGDQPHVGYDANNLYIATDEFCNAGYEGALLIAISKSQLLKEVPFPNAVAFGPLALGGDPILTLEPAISPNIGTEYLLNSFPYDQFGNNNSIANTLGFWHLRNGSRVTTGGVVTLVGQIITSEYYAFPQPAASTGTGAVVSNPCIPGITPPVCLPVTSEAFLNPDDSRMLQVQAVSTNGDIDLYAALSTAVTIPGDPSARDGVAWFKIDAESATFEAQGYVAVAGSYLLYPAIYHTNNGSTALVFTITSPTINPSAAYTVMSSSATDFGTVQIAGVGAGPHLSFSDAPPFNRPRWGDYSAATLDSSRDNVWLATEYIPPAAFQGAFDNWGTRVFEVAG